MSNRHAYYQGVCSLLTFCLDTLPMDLNEPVNENSVFYETTVPWKYTLRREMQEIIHGLFLGPYASAMKSKRQQLIDAGITHIVCVRRSNEAAFIHANFQDMCEYQIVDLPNNYIGSMIPLFRQINDFIDAAFRKNGRILVHGNNGSTYSPLFIIAYLIARTNLDTNAALLYVSKRRFCVYPTDEMRAQLLEFEVVARASTQTPNEIEMRQKISHQLEIEDDSHSTKKMFTG